MGEGWLRVKAGLGAVLALLSYSLCNHKYLLQSCSCKMGNWCLQMGL